MLGQRILQVFDLVEIDVFILLLLFLWLLFEIFSVQDLVVQLIFVIVTTLVSEEELLRISVDGDKCVLVGAVVVLDGAVVSLLVADFRHSIGLPLSLEDVGNERYGSQDQEAEGKQDSEEE